MYHDVLVAVLRGSIVNAVVGHEKVLLGRATGVAQKRFHDLQRWPHLYDLGFLFDLSWYQQTGSNGLNNPVVPQ